MQEQYKRPVINRLKTIRGHMDGVLRMVEDDTYCVDLLKQISALQASLERTNRLILENHLETCFSGAVADGRGQEAVNELLDALRYTPALTGADIAAGLVEAAHASDRVHNE